MASKSATCNLAEVAAHHRSGSGRHVPVLSVVRGQSPEARLRAGPSWETAPATAADIDASTPEHDRLGLAAGAKRKKKRKKTCMHTSSILSSSFQDPAALHWRRLVLEFSGLGNNMSSDRIRVAVLCMVPNRRFDSNPMLYAYIYPYG